jgi:hypothetical protein
MSEVTEKLSNKLHEAYETISKIESEIQDLFEQYEPELYKKLDFGISSDYYDNSIEVYFKIPLPYPYEPCYEIRKAIYDMGFSIVYWNFKEDKMDVICDRFIGKGETLVKDSIDEIRGYEPRHNKHAKWIQTKYGYVDDRFIESEWIRKYNFMEK